MAIYFVPPLMLQEAIDLAAASPDVENYIYIDELHLTSSQQLHAGFSADRKLIIRPKPGLRRAVIADHLDGSHPIFDVTGVGCVTFQDLDIVRDTTNNCDLMFIGDCNTITIERCRIGSIWRSRGARGWSNLRVKDPRQVMVRNSIFFAYFRGTLDYGIRIDFDTAQGCSLLLYNNVVADFKNFGIHATSPAISDAFLLLRNNVVVNHPSADPEPVPYHSEIFDMIVETSHNTAFVSLGPVETKAVVLGVEAQSISGETGAGFLRKSRAQIDHAFIEHTWIIDPEWDPNINFFRLVRGGPLHNEPSDAGINIIENHLPNQRDVPVIDDIERDVRPNGIPKHTDRGADQIREDDTFLDLGGIRKVRPRKIKL